MDANPKTFMDLGAPEGAPKLSRVRLDTIEPPLAAHQRPTGARGLWSLR